MPKLAKIALGLSLLMALVAGPAAAANKAQVLNEGALKLYDLIGGIKGAATQRAMTAFKKAGLSYHKELTVPIEGMLKCKSPEQLRLLLGAHQFDSTYAMIFGRKLEILAVKQYMETDLTDALKLRGKVRQFRLNPVEIKEITDYPNSFVANGIIIRNTLTNIELWIRAAQTDPEVMQVLVDGLYGAVIQGLYVSCKLGLAAGPTEKLVEVFNEQNRRVQMANEAIAAFAGEPSLAEMVNAGPRQKFIKDVQGVLADKGGKLSEADLKQILALVEPERAQFVQPCP